VKVRKVRTKPCKGYMYRVIGYDPQGQQVGHHDVMTLYQALWALGLLQKEEGATTIVIYDKQGKEIKVGGEKDGEKTDANMG